MITHPSVCSESHLKSSLNKILAHLQNAFFHFRRIVGIENVLPKLFIVNNLGFFLAFQHQQRFVVPAKDVVNIDTDKYLDFLHIR